MHSSYPEEHIRQTRAHTQRIVDLRGLSNRLFNTDCVHTEQASQSQHQQQRRRWQKAVVIHLVIYTCEHKSPYYGDMCICVCFISAVQLLCFFFSYFFLVKPFVFE